VDKAKRKQIMGDEIDEVNHENLNIEVQALEHHEEDHNYLTITVKVDPAFAATLLIGTCLLILGVWSMLNHELHTMKLYHAEKLRLLKQKLTNHEHRRRMQHLQQVKTLQELNVLQGESLNEMEQNIFYLTQGLDDARRNITEEQQKTARFYQELEIIQHNYTELSGKLQESQDVAETYQGQLNLINKIDEEIKKLETCYSHSQRRIAH